MNLICLIFAVLEMRWNAPQGFLVPGPLPEISSSGSVLELFGGKVATQARVHTTHHIHPLLERHINVI